MARDAAPRTYKPTYSKRRTDLREVLEAKGGQGLDLRLDLRLDHHLELRLPQWVRVRVGVVAGVGVGLRLRVLTLSPTLTLALRLSSRAPPATVG